MDGRVGSLAARYWLYCLHNLSFEGAHNLLCFDLSIVWRMAVVVVAG